jgi:hypothetical protein
MIQFERRGGRTAERAKLERTLAEANARASEPWRERVEGARRAVRDADKERQRFVAEHLTELVETLEADGRIAVADLNTHAEAVLNAYRERERIAAEIASLASMVGLLILGRSHLEHVLAAYVAHSNERRPHRSPRQRPPLALPTAGDGRSTATSPISTESGAATCSAG